MSNRKTQTYTPEYRFEAIKLVLEQGLSVSEAAARLSMNQGTQRGEISLFDCRITKLRRIGGGE